MSDVKNVKLGVCNVFFGGVDLGLTKGGVEVTVETQTHEVKVDQFGETTVNEIVMGRSCVSKVPLAETTLENLVKIMPGASLVSEGGAKATGKITVAAQPADGDTVTVNGVSFTFKTSGAGGNNVVIGANAAATASALLAVLKGSTAPAVAAADYTLASAAITVTNKSAGPAGNNFTLAASNTTATTLSGAKLTGGTAVTKQRVTVPTGVNLSLLNYAKELRLHPQAMPNDDLTEDFVMPLAATGGALNFAYQVDQERVFEVEFKAYPDILNDNVLFFIGA